MTDPNATISPQDARRSGTRILRAIHEEKSRRDTVPSVSPAIEFVRGAARKIVGAAFLWWAAVHLNEALAMAQKPGYELTKVDALRFGLPIGSLIVSGFLLAPSLTFTVLRFFGLGGLVDKLPFIKKAVSPEATP